MSLEGQVGDACHLLHYYGLGGGVLPSRKVLSEVFADLLHWYV